MAATTCAKCGNESFELKETPVAHAIYRLYFIQCSKCGSAIGVQEYYNAGALLKRIESLARKIAGALKVKPDALPEQKQAETNHEAPAQTGPGTEQ